MDQHVHHLVRARRRTGAAVVAAAVIAVGHVATASPAVADTTPCLLQATGCAIDRYDDPTTDFGDFDSTNIAVPPDTSAGSVNTNSYPYQSRTAPTGSGVTFHGLTNVPAGKAGADIALYDATLNKNSSGVAQPYLPCKNTHDPYKGACAQPTSAGYYSERSFAGGSSSNPWPIGMLIGNSTSNSYCSPCSHDWGRRVYEADLEFYPKLSDGKTTDLNWVRPRFSARNVFAPSPSGNGYNMTPDWGTIPGRYISDANVGRLSGTVWATTGVADANSRLRFSVFAATHPATNVSSTGRQVDAFFVGADGTNGFYTTGAMYAAAYNMRITDQTNGHSCYFASKSWTTTGLRADFWLDRPHFGRSDYSSCNF